MKVKSSLSALSLALLSLLVCGVAQAESQYGYSTAGTGNVSATARLNISVVVPKVVLLRVGDAGATQNTLNFAARVAIPLDPSGSTNVDGATPDVNSNNQAISWNGAIPTVSLLSNTATIGANAWTNGSTVKVNCAATTPFTAGGPTLANLTATNTTGNLPHPGGSLGACSATGNLSTGTLYSATWTYTLDASNAVNWAAGTYSALVTYTASDI